MIEDRSSEGCLIVCASHPGGHRFLVERLCLTIECPKCGCTAISTLVVEEFAARQAFDSRRVA